MNSKKKKDNTPRQFCVLEKHGFSDRLCWLMGSAHGGSHMMRVKVFDEDGVRNIVVQANNLRTITDDEMKKMHSFSHIHVLKNDSKSKQFYWVFGKTDKTDFFCKNDCVWAAHIKEGLWSGRVMPRSSLRMITTKEHEEAVMLLVTFHEKEQEALKKRCDDNMKANTGRLLKLL